MDLHIKKVYDRWAVSLKSVAEQTGVKEAYVKGLVESRAEMDGIKSGEDYASAWRTYWFFPSGLMWLLGAINCRDYKRSAELMGTLINFSEGGAVEKLVALVPQLVEIKEALKLAQETVDQTLDGITENATNKVPEEVKAVKANKEKAGTAFLPRLTDEEQEWRDKFDDVLAQKIRETGINGRDLLGIAYTVMRNSYGIVFAQTRKEFARENDIQDGTRISKLALITRTPELRSIMWGVMGEIETHIKNDEAKAV